MKSPAYIFWRIFGKLAGKRLARFPKAYLTYLYNLKFGYSPDWNQPRDLNEWIQKLQLSPESAQWPRYADKLRVREYVAECGYTDILVPLYGSWTSADEIDFDSLPNEFVLKTNHGCGDVKIVRDKKEFFDSAEKDEYWGGVKTLLSTTYGLESGELHYMRIQKPYVILAEKLLDARRQSVVSTSLVDYKMWCINGRFEACMVIFNRTKSGFETALYDKGWNPIPGLVESPGHLKISDNEIPRPLNWDKMIEIAERLSAPFKQSRIDLYEVDGKVYFGEITLTSAAGRMGYFTRDFLKKLGDKIASLTR